MSSNVYYDEDEEGEFREFLEALVRNDHIEGAVAGITKQVIDRGCSSLSTKQQFVFEQDVIRAFAAVPCSDCGNEIPWSEKTHALDNGGLCNWCWHRNEKDE